MANKIRVLSVSSSVLLVVATIWSALEYGPTTGYLPYLVPLSVALLLFVLPGTLAYCKLAIYNAGQWWENRESLSFERGTVYKSDVLISDRATFLDDVSVFIADEDGYDEVRREEFPEGEGLSIVHAGFHNTFVRVTERGRVIVTGASKRSRDLAALIERHLGFTMEHTWRNPLLKPRPVGGAPRVFLGVFLVVLLLAGAGSLGATAYPTSSYNSAEKVALVGLDARADMPGIDENAVRLQKATFLVGIVEEEAVEIKWEQNRSGEIAKHAEDAVYASDHAARVIEAVMEDGDATQRQQATAIDERRLKAEREVASALESRNEGNISGRDLTRMQRVLDNRTRAAGET